jgi:tripartite-type tricarboxylate transporter receptor subunit TctC
VQKALKDPGVKGIEDSGATPVSNSPEAFAAFVQSEVTKWSKAAQDAGVRAQ